MGSYSGTTGNDTVAGEKYRANTFSNFGRGSDSVGGGDYNDVFYLTADAQKDVIVGGSGRDKVDYSASSFGLTIDLQGSGGIGSVLSKGSLSPPPGTRVADLYGIEDAVGTSYADDIYGTGGDNTLSGGGGSDKLFGRGGNDVLIGGAASDEQYGGTGTDTFRFLLTADSSVSSPDKIRDLNDSEFDVIDLSAIDANTTVSGNQAFSYLAVPQFTGTAGELIVSGSDGGWLVQADTNGDAQADFALQVYNAPGTIITLGDGNFIL